MAELPETPADRIIDVNLNRLGEGLKAIEDLIRFGSRNLDLLKKIRNLRQEIGRLLGKIDYPKIVRSRRTDYDPGVDLRFDRTKDRDLKKLMIRSFARTKQASRTLEELMDRRWKKIRFEVYELEKIALSPQFDFDSTFYVVWDERYLDKKNFLKKLATLVKGGVTTIQFRVKEMHDRDYLRVLKKARKEIPKGITMIVNNRLDLALASGADGVHLGNSDLPVKEARKVGGVDLIIGATVRNLIHLKKSEPYADYLGVGSIFRSPTKPNARVIGVRSLKKIVRMSQKPVVAIGGITPSSAMLILKAGATGIAVSSFIFVGDLKKNLKKLTQAIRSSSGSR